MRGHVHPIYSETGMVQADMDGGVAGLHQMVLKTTIRTVAKRSWYSSRSRSRSF
jgi:hypothetical protein